MTNQEALRMAYSKRKDSAGEERDFLNIIIQALEQTRWIPVSERLPEDGTWNMFTDGKQISVERFKLDAINHFFPEGRWFSFDEAVAWMPLPPCYEPQESDNRRCGNCKYFGEVLKENDTPHSCNNNKSIFKACLETATGCEKFEPQESEE